VAQAQETAARAPEFAQSLRPVEEKNSQSTYSSRLPVDDASPFVRIPKAILPELSELIKIPAFRHRVWSIPMLANCLA